MNKMLLCLNNQYELLVNENDKLAVIELEDTIDSLLYLLKSYGIEDEEIIDTIKNETDLEIIKEN